MIIPIKCFTCGNVLADKYRYYLEKVREKKIAKDMDCINPCYIPRNHIIEEALNNAVNNNMSKINKLLEIFKNPYKKQNISEDYLTPSNSESPYVTFCGT